MPPPGMDRVVLTDAAPWFAGNFTRVGVEISFGASIVQQPSEKRRTSGPASNTGSPQSVKQETSIA